MFDLRNKNIYVGNQAIDRVYLGEELLKSNEPAIYMATDEDFKLDGWRVFYIGSVLEVDITDYVNRGRRVQLSDMFNGNYDATPVTKVALGPSSVTTMSSMFRESKATSLDLSSFDTSNVTSMSFMFFSAQATSMDLSSFDTSNVTDMRYMFSGSQATSLDLSSFDTSSVTNMSSMFANTQATTLDLSSFDTSNVTDMWNIFSGSQATIGYARTQADADRFNSTNSKPSGLTFVVHPDLI